MRLGKVRKGCLGTAQPRDLFVHFIKNTKPVERSKLLPGDIFQK